MEEGRRVLGEVRLYFLHLYILSHSFNSRLRFCQKIKANPEDCLRKRDREIYKAYLRWRKKHFRVKKENSMRSYWNRICMYYRDLTCHKMDADVLMDVGDVHLIPTFLSRSYILIASVVDSKSSA